MRLHALAFVLLASVIGLAPRDARAVPAPANVTAKYLYQLSSSTGEIPSSWASLIYDPGRKELYVVDRSDGTVGIFNDVGIEIYRFGDDSELGAVLSVDVIGDSGDLVVVVAEGPMRRIKRCNFRGEPKDEIRLRNLPAAFAKDFNPETVRFRDEKLYLADLGMMKVAVADASGNVLEVHDYYRELGIDKDKQGRTGPPGMHAFTVDPEGYLLFTVAPMFRVFVIAPDGKASSFGERGGAPGRFNIVAGVARDENGNIFVSDVLKCAVLVFNDKFQFQGQFGARGWGPGAFIAPREVAFGDGKLYVSQSAWRGVSVFELSFPGPASEPTAAQ
jgi:DNA-binding beta-propeller fold protein YncE